MENKQNGIEEVVRKDEMCGEQTKWHSENLRCVENKQNGTVKT